MKDYQENIIEGLHKDISSVFDKTLCNKERIDKLEKRVGFLSDVLIKNFSKEEIMEALSKNTSMKD